ncbi:MULTISPECIES: AraC family transcriptional regulator [unclassified Duganella]|uniref:AraC family transcriptional regulator n=1 Tax=unclassified Duganella TaxID=2636909 RepID=UPI000E341A5A|nr:MULTISPECIES: AraC family transcriptional regulator [unclassified Duganella]RFP18692.1 AraC family transcriptional regulator [Duganella sp. BJB475]RFP35357.1 AraC family transcriptional regulator [Duganella sp. BJB476]
MKQGAGAALATAADLAQLVGGIAQSDGDYVTQIPALTVYRRSAATDPMPCIYGLGLGLAVQGGKRVTLGDEIFDYGPGQSLVTSVDLPVTSYVTRASHAEPYLGIRLELDGRAISQVAAEMDFSSPLKTTTSRAISVVTLDDSVQDALIRLIRLLDEPHIIPFVGPLIQQEIIVRLLRGEHGPMLRHLVTMGSPSQQIAKVITWLKQHFAGDFPIDDLAAQAHMSPSTFRQHFRVVAGMSPLQYLKQLRLQDARQLMLNENIDAGSAALRVGYESASQFSREYTRLFGAPPLRDIRRLQEASESMAERREH